ncbi:MAG: DUF4340 domain-containing protein [Clostridia bacterium]|nr:DUF4340 domain-containing protein [Clostridia bacterium]
MKKNSKRLRNIIILAGVLLLLIAVFLAIKLGSREDGEETGTQTEAYTVANLDPQTLTGISLAVKGSDELVFTLKDDQTGWVWSGDGTVPLDNNAFANVVTALNGATSGHRLTGVTAEESESYGLSDPRVRIGFSFSDGSVWSGLVGNYNSFSKGYYFTTGEDGSTVYLISESAGNSLMLDISDFLLRDEPPEVTAAGIRTLTFEKGGSSFVYSYYPSGNPDCYTDSFRWFLSVDGGAEIPVSPALGDRLASAMTSLYFDDCLAFRSDTDLSAYGLDDPVRMTLAYTVSETVSDSTTGTETTVKKDAEWVLLLGGSDEDGALYVKTESSNLVYTSGYSETLAVLSGGDLTKIRPSELVLFNPSMTDRIDFSAGSTSLGVVITHGDSGESYSNASGADLNYTEYSALADRLTGTAASSNTSLVESDPAVLSDTPVFGAVFTFGETVAELKITPWSQNWYRVSFFGRDDQLITAGDLEELTAALEAAAG